ncbi:hypothetical protein [Streptomyces sp. DW26H14]|uniref:hypothetical protein n=1 Tax=Streptomyces sp. DW26H14 TaxID=3435395 RepID=UPI00403DEAF5
MSAAYTASGWCHWHHAPADTLALIAVAPATSGQDLYACAECRTAFRLVPAVEVPAEVWAAARASGERAPERCLVTPCVGGGHDFPIEDDSGAYCPEHGVEIQRLPQQACAPHRLLQALAEELTTAGGANV